MEKHLSTPAKDAPCPMCSGTGYQLEWPCEACGGNGQPKAKAGEPSRPHGSKRQSDGLPWSDCKVAFDLNTDPDDFWTWYDGEGRHLMPRGWGLNETDGTGARYVAVFRVEVMPSAEDGATVAHLIKSFEAREKQHG